MQGDYTSRHIKNRPSEEVPWCVMSRQILASPTAKEYFMKNLSNKPRNRGYGSLKEQGTYQTKKATRVKICERCNGPKTTGKYCLPCREIKSSEHREKKRLRKLKKQLNIERNHVE